IDEESGCEEGRAVFLTIAEVRGELMLTEALRSAEDDVGAVARAIVVRRPGLSRIVLDLLLRKRARQALALLVSAELERSTPRSPVAVQLAGEVCFLEVAVTPVAVGILAGDGEAASEVLPLEAAADARFLGAEAAVAPEHAQASLAGLRLARDDVDRSGGGVRAVQHGAAAAHDL